MNKGVNLKKLIGLSLWVLLVWSVISIFYKEKECEGKGNGGYVI